MPARNSSPGRSSAISATASAGGRSCCSRRSPSPSIMLLMAAAPTLAWLFVGRLDRRHRRRDLRAGQRGARRRHRAREAGRDLRADGRGVRRSASSSGRRSAGCWPGSARARHSSSPPRSPAPTPCGSLFALPETLPPERRRPFDWRARQCLRRVHARCSTPAARRRCWSPPCSGSSRTIRLSGDLGLLGRARAPLGRPAQIGWSLAAAGPGDGARPGLVTGRAIARFGEAAHGRDRHARSAA